MNDNSAITKGRLANRYFILVCSVGLALNFGINLLTCVFPLHIDFLGYPTSMTGLLNFPYLVSCIVGRFVSGYMTDNISRRSTLILGAAIFGVAAILYGFVPGLFSLFLARSLQGFGFAMGSTATAAANGDTVPPEKIGVSSGIYYATSSIAMFTTGFIVAPLTEGTQFKAPYITIVAILALGALCGFMCTYEKLPGVAIKPDKSHGGLSKFFDKRAIKPSLPFFFVCLGAACNIHYIVLFGTKNDISNPGMFVTVVAVVSLVANMLCSRLTSKFSTSKVLVPACVVCGLAMIFLGIFKTVSIFYVAAVCFGLCFGLCFPIFYNIILKTVPSERYGAASSTLMMSNDIGYGIGGILWGTLISYVGFTPAFCAAGGMYILAAILYIYLFRERSTTINANQTA